MIADGHDVYGSGVNLAARLTGLAGPGEIVVSADVRDQLTPCSMPISRIWAGAISSTCKSRSAPIASARRTTPRDRARHHGDAATAPDDRRHSFHRTRGQGASTMSLARCWPTRYCGVSRSAELNVISRLSTTVFRGRETSIEEVSRYLTANYVLSGAYRKVGSKLRINVELADHPKSGAVVWSEAMEGNALASSAVRTTSSTTWSRPSAWR